MISASVLNSLTGLYLAPPHVCMFLHIASHGHRSDVENMAQSLGCGIGLCDSISSRIGNNLLKEDGKKIFVSGFKFRPAHACH